MIVLESKEPAPILIELVTKLGHGNDNTTTVLEVS